jgi:hypothetical protein
MRLTDNQIQRVIDALSLDATPQKRIAVRSALINMVKEKKDAKS